MGGKGSRRRFAHPLGRSRAKVEQVGPSSTKGGTHGRLEPMRWGAGLLLTCVFAATAIAQMPDVVATEVDAVADLLGSEVPEPSASARSPDSGRTAVPLDPRFGSRRALFDTQLTGQLREEIERFRVLREARQDRTIQRRLDDLARRPEHLVLRRSLLEALDAAQLRPSTRRTSLGHRLVLARLAAQWVHHVDGRTPPTTPSVPPRERPQQQRRRELQYELDLYVARLSSQIEDAGRVWARTSGPSTSARPTRPAPRWPFVAGGVILGALGLGFLAGSRRRSRTPPSSPQAISTVPGLASGALPADPVPLALNGTTEKVGAGARSVRLAGVRALMSLYLTGLHPLKNQLGIASRYEGDPDGLMAQIFDPDVASELNARLDTSRAALEALARQPLDGDLADCVKQGCEVLGRVSTRFHELATTSRTPPPPDFAATVEATVTTMARWVRDLSTRVCNLADRHSLDPRGVAQDVMSRAPIGQHVELEFTGDVPERLLIEDAQSARAGLALALQNLLDNAHQAGARRVRLAVAFATGSNGSVAGQLEVRVCDDGPGVSPEVQQRLFTPRFTTRTDGTGMGLFGVRRTAQELGGDAGFDAPNSGGAAFWIRFPAVAL